MGTRRPKIPDSVKDLVWDRSDGVCAICGKPIKDRGQCQFNHQPALTRRPRREGLADTNPRAYIPNANDPEYIFAVHSSQTSAEKCHDKQTFGDGLYRGDVTEGARIKRHADKKVAEAERAAAKVAGAPAPRGKPKQKMQSRPFDKRHRPMPGSKAHPSKLRVRMNKKVKSW